MPARKKTASAHQQVSSMIVRALGGKLSYRYNEAIADGFLPCAPETVQGGPRSLAHIDIFAMAIFFRCLMIGLPSRHAGTYTCLAVNVMKGQLKSDGTLKIFKIAIARNGDGQPKARGIAKFSDMHELDCETSIVFDLSAIGDKVKAALDEAL